MPNRHYGPWIDLSASYAASPSPPSCRTERGLLNGSRRLSATATADRTSDRTNRGDGNRRSVASSVLVGRIVDVIRSWR